MQILLWVPYDLVNAVAAHKTFLREFSGKSNPTREMINKESLCLIGFPLEDFSIMGESFSHNVRSVTLRGIKKYKATETEMKPA